MGEFGTLFGCGVGPGDPELITLKAWNLLRSTPVVCVPVKERGEKSYAYGIVERYLDLSHQRKVELVFPMTKDKEALGEARKIAASIVLDLLARGNDVVFVTEGDPLFYSTFVYLFEALVGEVPPGKIQIVPGVTAFCASGARGGFPYADGDEKLAIIPSTYGVGMLGKLLDDFDTVVLMKVNSVLEEVKEEIRARDLDGCFLFVERCGRPEERIVRTLRELDEIGKPNYLSLMILHPALKR